jgi:hypothetical protein
MSEIPLRILFLNWISRFFYPPISDLEDHETQEKILAELENKKKLKYSFRKLSLFSLDRYYYLFRTRTLLRIDRPHHMTGQFNFLYVDKKDYSYKYRTADQHGFDLDHVVMSILRYFRGNRFFH